MQMFGVGDAVLLDAENNIVFSEERPTVVLGLDDVVVVQAEGVTLVCAADRAEENQTFARKFEG